MKKENLFYLIFVLTILAYRVILFFVPQLDLDIIIFNVEIHHLGFGLIVMLIGLIIPRKRKKLKIFIFAVGTGMVIDELLFIILTPWGSVYWGLPSLLGMVVLAIAMYPARKKVTRFLLGNER